MAISLNSWEIIYVHRSDKIDKHVSDDFAEIHTMYKDYHGDMVDFSNYISNSLWLGFRVSRYDKSLINSSDKISEVTPQLSDFTKQLYQKFIAEKAVLSNHSELKNKNVKYDLGFFKTLLFVEQNDMTKIEVNLKENSYNKRYIAFDKQITEFLIKKYEKGSYDILKVDNIYRAEDNFLFWYLYNQNESDLITRKQKNNIFDYLIKNKSFFTTSQPIQISYPEIANFLNSKKKQVFSSLLIDKGFEVYLNNKNEDVYFYHDLINEVLSM